MSDRGQFTFYRSFRESIKRIKNHKDRALAYDILCDYALDGTEPNVDNLPDIVAMAFINAKPNLLSSRRKAESGKKGGTTKQTASKPQANHKQTASEKEGEKEKEKEKEYECTPPPPSLEIPEAKITFADFWEAYPNSRGGENAALAAWEAIVVTQEVGRRIMSALEQFKKSASWTEKDGKFIPGAAKFLEEKHWEKPPILSYDAVPKGASGELGDAEIEAIERVLRENVEGCEER